MGGQHGRMKSARSGGMAVLSQCKLGLFFGAHFAHQANQRSERTIAGIKSQDQQQHECHIQASYRIYQLDMSHSLNL
jgi:hypothetical protein